jgi:putative ABC transport system permease protein
MQLTSGRTGAQARSPLALLLTLASGILAFILLSALETQISRALLSRSRDLLGADLALSSRRWIQPSELEIAQNTLKQEARGGGVRTTEVLELFTMAAMPGKTPQLVELHAIEPDYPLSGSLEFEAPCPAGESCVHGDAALSLRWDLRAGISRLRIGERQFVWGGKITRDTSRSLRGGAMAPRVVLRRADLASTGLLRSGATFTVRKLFALSPPPEGATLERLSESLNRSIRDPGIQIQVPKDAAADEGRLLASVGDFLGLTSLVGLILAFVGCYWLLRRLVQQDARNWAIYRVLSPRALAPELPFWRLTLTLSLAAAALAVITAQAIWMLGAPALSRFLLVEGGLSPLVPAPTLFQALILSVATSAFALLPSLRFLRRQAAREGLMTLLKNPAILAQRPGVTAGDALVLLTLLALVSRWVAHSWRVAGAFLAGLVLAALASALIGWGVLKSFEALAGRVPSSKAGAALRHTLLSLCRLRASSLLIWTTLTLGALLISLVPMIEASLRVQLSDPRDAGPVPGLFLFDIQEEQLEPVKSWAKDQGTELQFVTPLIRGRLVNVNGIPFEKLSDAPSTREEEREARFRNRGFNLTYRDSLSPSERLIEGVIRPALPLEGGVEAVTLERRFAERLKIGIGDRLAFDIQGVPIAAEVVGIRSVQWTSFQPNFFIVFEPRALLDAPKTYLAALPSMGVESRERLQSSLFDRFANISTIDVTRLMETLLEGFGQISQALALMAILSILSGAMAIFSVAGLRARERLPEMQLLKLLGMDRRALQASMTGELAVLAGAASVTGLVLATLLAGFMSRWVFESPVLPPSPLLCVIVVGGFWAAGGILGALASRRVVAQAPETWLKGLAAEL